MNRLSLLSSFAAVAGARSFTRAAERLGLSKSVVSRHVSELERDLGTQLLYRSTHGLSLTDAGERCYAHCKDLEQVADQATASAASAEARPGGLLRVTMPQMLVVSPVGGLITGFQRAHPEVSLDVRVTSLQIDPVEEGFDVALRFGALKDSSLVGRRLCEVKYLAVAAQEYLRRCGTPRTRDDLKRHNLLVFSEFGSRAWRTGRPAQAGSALTGTLSTNSGVLLMNALLAGQGIAIGPNLLFDQHLKSRRLRALPGDFAGGPTGLHAVFPQGRFPAPARRAFVDYLVAALAG